MPALHVHMRCVTHAWVPWLQVDFYGISEGSSSPLYTLTVPRTA